MNYREVVIAALEDKPPYVPWNLSFTHEAHQKLVAHYQTDDLDLVLQNHFVTIADDLRARRDLGDGRFEDAFGVVWDQSVDRDIGIVEGCVLPKPTLDGYEFPTVSRDDSMGERLATQPDRFRVFAIGFSLYERAWTLRGMENLMMDFYDNPGFVHELLTSITDCNIARIEAALENDFDAVHFGDDWGQQQGLQMGPRTWHEFIYPQLRRIYKVVKDAGKYVTIHSCGDVDELFDDLIEIGLNCFNPFQPEVMDPDSLMAQFRGRLAFHGGLSTQRTLPYGTPDDVRREVRHLLELGRNGGYIFAPAHSVEGDVPLENMLAFIDEMKQQPGFVG